MSTANKNKTFFCQMCVICQKEIYGSEKENLSEKEQLATL